MVATTRIVLIVEDADHQAVRDLGARWDARGRTWFLEPGVEPAPFARWLPGTNADSDPGETPSPAAGATQGVSLSSLLLRVKAVIKAGLAEPVWVRAELRKVSIARSGHVYLELEERDDQGQAVAKSAATLWANRAPSLRARFAAGTGGDLRPDIKVLLLVRADFHPAYGFALSIDDIDPSYTLGDLLARLEAIRAALRGEGAFDLNRSLPPPRDFFRVAVICPATSAGQGDFRSEADRLQAAGICGFDYYHATFQGASAPASIREGLRAAYEAHKGSPYDALAVIRGGGSVTDLAWLDDLKLARWVCRLPIPVFTGIDPPLERLHQCRDGGLRLGRERVPEALRERWLFRHANVLLNSRRRSNVGPWTPITPHSSASFAPERSPDSYATYGRLTTPGCSGQHGVFRCSHRGIPL